MGVEQADRLRSFWARRAKRLLPAVLVLLLVLTLYDWLGGPNISSDTFRPDAIATLFYYANWHLIFTHQSYFTQFLAPSPLKHTWSLAIEEQFYLSGRSRPGHVPPGQAPAAPRLPCFPRRRPSSSPPSWPSPPPWRWRFFPTGRRPSRIYYGTDTRVVRTVHRGDPGPRGHRPAGSPAPGAPGPPCSRTAAPSPSAPVGVRRRRPGQPVGLDVPRGPGAGRHPGRSGHRQRGPAATPGPGHGHVDRPAPVDRSDLLWPLPVALAGLRPHDRRHHRALRCALLLARLAATLGAATASFYLIERPMRRYRWKGWPFALATLSAVGVTALAIVPGRCPRPRPYRPPDYASVRVVSPTARPDPFPAPIVLPPGQVGRRPSRSRDHHRGQPHVRCRAGHQGRARGDRGGHRRDARLSGVGPDQRTGTSRSTWPRPSSRPMPS